MIKHLTYRQISKANAPYYETTDRYQPLVA